MTTDDRTSAQLLLEAYECVKLVESRYEDYLRTLQAGPLQDAKNSEELVKAAERISWIEIDHLNMLDRITTPLLAALVIELNDGNHIDVADGDGLVTYALQEDVKFWQKDVDAHVAENVDYVKYAKRQFGEKVD